MCRKQVGRFFVLVSTVNIIFIDIFSIKAGDFDLKFFFFSLIILEFVQ